MAAGKSTRMKSALPKAAHPVCGKPVTRHVIDACLAAGVESIVVVVGFEAEKVKAALGEDVAYAVQAEQLGTGHACIQALPSVPGDVSTVIVLPGDTPLITPEAISALLGHHRAESCAATLLTVVLDDPGVYGRVVRDGSGGVVGIVEARDADKATLAIGEVNTSIYCFDRDSLSDALSQLSSDNAQGEYYLTDVIGLLRGAGKRIGALAAENPADAMGINTRVELADAADEMRRRINSRHMLAGVTIVDPSSTCIDCDVQIGADSVIHPFTVIERFARIGPGQRIGPFAHVARDVTGGCQSE